MSAVFTNQDLQRRLDEAKHLAEQKPFSLLFIQDPTFDPFTIDYWIRNENDARALYEGYYPDLEVALRWGSFFPIYLRHPDAEPSRAKPFYLEPFQRDDLTLPLFGWMRPQREGQPNGNRHRTADLFMPKKNGKTTWLAGVVAGIMKMTPKPVDMFGSAFVTAQAKKLFADVRKYLNASPINEEFKFKNSPPYQITYQPNESFYRVLPGESGAGGNDGIDAAFVAFDEIHRNKTRELYDVFDGCGIAQPWHMFISVSTFGEDDETQIWMERLNYARRYLANEITDLQYFALIYEASDDVLTSEEARLSLDEIRRANPACMNESGRGFLDPDFILQKVREAHNNPLKLHNVLRLHYNKLTSSSVDNAIPKTSWKNCESQRKDLLAYLKKGEVYLDDFGQVKTKKRKCYAALDMSSHDDLTAIAAFFPFTDAELEKLPPEIRDRCELDQLTFGESEEDDDEEMVAEVPIVPGYLVFWVYCPQGRIREKEKIYSKWAADGHLITIPGKSVKGLAIKKQLRQINADFQMLELAYDKWGTEGVIPDLENGNMVLVEVDQQKFGMDVGCRALINQVVDECVRHDGNPCVAWCAGNVVASNDPVKIKFDKKKSSGKIDPLQAAAMAMGRCVVTWSEYKDFDGTLGYFDENGNIKSKFLT